MTLPRRTLLAGALAAPAIAHAQHRLPWDTERPIRLIHNGGAGSGSDAVTRVLAQFLLADPEPLLFHNEPVLCDGTVIGHLTSGAYGHALGAAVGLGYVPAASLAGRFEIEVEGRLVPATASLRPFYDPESARVRV